MIKRLIKYAVVPSEPPNKISIESALKGLLKDNIDSFLKMVLSVLGNDIIHDKRPGTQSKTVQEWIGKLRLDYNNATGDAKQKAKEQLLDFIGEQLQIIINKTSEEGGLIYKQLKWLNNNWQTENKEYTVNLTGLNQYEVIKDNGEIYFTNFTGGCTCENYAKVSPLFMWCKHLYVIYNLKLNPK